MRNKELVREALEARKQSYCPYSGFAVGAALLCGDGTVFRGCNIENAAYSPTVCAERVAMLRAIYEGEREFDALAIVWDGDTPAVPCGVCRQVMREFCGEDFVILLARQDGAIRRFTLAQLLPESFTLTEASPDHPSQF